MHFHSSPQNIFQSSASQITQDLNKYKNLLTTYRGNCYRQPPQNQYLLKLLSNQMDKIEIQIQKIYQYLQQKEENDLENIIKQFIECFKQSNELFREFDKNNKNIRNFKKQNNSNNIICYNCKQNNEKIKIQKIKFDIGLTQGDIITQKNQDNKDQIPVKNVINIKQFLKNDDYEEKHNLHIENLEAHIISLMNIIEKQYQSKTSSVLGKQHQIYRKNQLQLKAQGDIIKQNEKQFQESENYYQKFKENFIKFISVPIQEAVTKIYQNMERKKSKQHQQQLAQAETQTLISPDNVNLINLENKLHQLLTQNKKLKSNKTDNERNILKYMQIQNQLKKQLNTALQEKSFLEERFKQAQQNFNIIQGRFQVEITIKCKQISKLQKQILELKHQRQVSLEKQKEKLIKVQIIPSRKSIVSIKNGSRRESKKTLKDNQRSSLDFSIDGQESTQNYTYTRFYQGKKHQKYINAIRNTKNSQDSWKYTSKGGREESADSQPTQIIQHHKQYNLTLISNQVNLQIEPFSKQTPTPKQQTPQSNLTKKIKSLRLLKTYKKQNNTTSVANTSSFNLKSQTSNNRSTDHTSPLIPVTENKLDIDQQEVQSKTNSSRKSLSNTYQDFHTQRYKTEAFETIEEEKQILTNRKISRQRKKYVRPIRDSIRESTSNSGRKSVRTGGILVRQFRLRTEADKENNSSLLPDLKNQFLTLFGSEKYALDYEKNSGIWSHLVTVGKLVVDCQNSNFATQIQSYFNHLSQNQDPKLNQYLLFLTQPATYFQMRKKSQNEITQHPNIDVNDNKIKILFTKLIRFHKLLHRNCNHVFEFLDSIGFFSC